MESESYVVEEERPDVSITPKASTKIQDNTGPVGPSEVTTEFHGSRPGDVSVPWSDKNLAPARLYLSPRELTNFFANRAELACTESCTRTEFSSTRPERPRPRPKRLGSGLG